MCSILSFFFCFLLAKDLGFCSTIMWVNFQLLYLYNLYSLRTVRKIVYFPKPLYRKTSSRRLASRHQDCSRVLRRTNLVPRALFPLWREKRPGDEVGVEREGKEGDGFFPTFFLLKKWGEMWRMITGWASVSGMGRPRRHCCSTHWPSLISYPKWLIFFRL